MLSCVFNLMLSIYGNTILLCLILYPLATLLNSLFNFNNLSVDFLTIWRPESSRCYCYHRCLWNHSLRPRNRRPDTECGALPPQTPASQQQSPPPFYFPDPTHAHLIGRYSHRTSPSSKGILFLGFQPHQREEHYDEVKESHSKYLLH